MSATVTNGALPAGRLEVDQATGSRGNFFAVDSGNWERACAAGLNVSVAYLVLASGTGPDNRTTSWSTNAIEKRTKISRFRARDAIAKLIEIALVKPIGGPPSKPKYKLTASSGEPKLIWLPNSIVSVSTGDAPIETIRETQDISLLRLFVNLYDLQTLPSEGGIDRREISVPFEKSIVAERGNFRVFGFLPCELVIQPNARLLTNHIGLAPTAKDRKITAGEIAAGISTLERLGLIEFVCHIIESDDDDAEILHPAPLPGTGLPVERALSDAALAAALALLTDEEIISVQDRGLDLLVPIPTHLIAVEAVGIARLTHRPKTAMTVEWLGRASRWQNITADLQAFFGDSVESF